MSSNVTVAAMRAELKRRLSPIYGNYETDAMIRLIFHALKGWDTTALAINFDSIISDNLIRHIDNILMRLEKHEPIQYILGETRFYGFDLKVTPDVLIPRPETAELVDIIVKQNSQEDLRVLDIGTGSGVIAIALCRNLKFPQVTALDFSPKAIEVAKENAKILNTNIKFINADIFDWDALADSFDIIVSNPPYVTESEKTNMEENVLDYEPHSALFVPDNDPLLFYRRIADVSIDSLTPEGTLYFEINPLYAEMLKEMLLSKGYKSIELIRDSYGKLRFAIARKA